MSRSILLLLVCLACCSTRAHLSAIGVFDTSRTIEVSGTVESYSWRNPHGQIVLAGDDGRQWHAETTAVSMMRNRGVSADDVIAVGDRVSPWPGHPMSATFPRSWLATCCYRADTSSISAAATLTFRRAGTAISWVESPTKPRSTRKPPHADGIFRVWSTVMSDPDSFPMFRGGYPMTPAGEAALAAWNPLDNDLLRCDSKAMPLIMITPFPIDFVRQGDDILMRIEEFDARRINPHDG